MYRALRGCSWGCRGWYSTHEGGTGTVSYPVEKVHRREKRKHQATHLRTAATFPWGSYWIGPSSCLHMYVHEPEAVKVSFEHPKPKKTR